jgi:hypothetical protein
MKGPPIAMNLIAFDHLSGQGLVTMSGHAKKNAPELILALTEKERADLEAITLEDSLDFWRGIYRENPRKGAVPLLAHILLLAHSRTPTEVYYELIRRNAKIFPRQAVAEMIRHWDELRSTIEHPAKLLRIVASHRIVEQPIDPTLGQTAKPTSGAGIDGKPSPRRRPNNPCGVTIIWAYTDEMASVTLEDGREFLVTPEQAAVIDVLVKAYLGSVTYAEMTKRSPLLVHQNAGKIGRDLIDKMPKDLRDRIDRTQGKGCQWIN